MSSLSLFLLAAFVTGGAIGALTARRRGGNRLDMAQYGGVYGLIAACAAVLVLFIGAKLIG